MSIDDCLRGTILVYLTSASGTRVVALPVRARPPHWTADDARDVAWTLVRLLDAHAVFELGIAEVRPMRLWTLRAETDAGTATTQWLALSDDAMVWWERHAFALPASSYTASRE